MEDSMYTMHARHRMKNRGISAFVVDLLLLYGDEEHDGRGGVRRYLTKRTRKRVRRAIGSQVYKRIGRCLDAYVVECDGKIVTVGWRQ